MDETCRSRSWPETPFPAKLLFMLVLVLAACSCTQQNAALPAAQVGLTTVRIGWQTAWATQGQLAMVLMKTNALELNRLTGDFKAFTYGAPLSEAALAGQIDVAFVGDQPAVNLLSRSSDWKIVARLMDFRVAIVVPADSPVKEVSDLRGKTLGVPFGASTHRFALEALREAGLDPAKDLTILNIDILEQSDIVKAGGGGAWPKVDAFASWDHHVALYEQLELARILKSGTALGVVMMSQKFIDAHPQEAAGFLAAFKLAYLYYATHQDQADQWFAEAAGGKFDLALLKKVAEIEPNLQAAALPQVDIGVGDAQRSVLQNAADFAAQTKLISQPLTISECLRPELSQRAEQELSQDGSLETKVQYNN